MLCPGREYFIEKHMWYFFRWFKAGNFDVCEPERKSPRRKLTLSQKKEKKKEKERILSKIVNSTGSKSLEHHCDWKRFFCYWKKNPSIDCRISGNFEFKIANFLCFQGGGRTYGKILFLIRKKLCSTVAR